MLTDKVFFSFHREEVRVVNTGAEEDDLEQVQSNLPLLNAGKLSSGNSALSVLIYEPTQALAHFESCSCPLILDLCQRSTVREFAVDAIISQSKSGLFSKLPGNAIFTEW